MLLSWFCSCKVSTKLGKDQPNPEEFWVNLFFGPLSRPMSCFVFISMIAGTLRDHTISFQRLNSTDQACDKICLLNIIDNCDDMDPSI